MHLIAKRLWCTYWCKGPEKSAIIYPLAEEMFEKEGYQIDTANKQLKILEREK